MLTCLKFLQHTQQWICSKFLLKMPQHFKCLATVIYDLQLIIIFVSNCHLFSDITISQGSVATNLRCGGTFSYHFTANLLPSLTVKEFWKFVKIWQSSAISLVVQFFLEHSVDVVYCYWPSSMVVCRSVILVIPAKTAELIEMPFGLWVWMGPGYHELGGGPDPHEKRQFWGKGLPIVKYRVFLPWVVQKQLNWSICHLGCGLGWAEGSTSSIVFARWRQCADMGWHIGATWRIRLNHLSAAAMRSYVILLWPFVIIIIIIIIMPNRSTTYVDAALPTV